MFLPLRYLRGQACINGHPVTGDMDGEPGRTSAFCASCGAPTISACPACGEMIRGLAVGGGIIAQSAWRPERFCFKCGTAYPWEEARQLRSTDSAPDEEPGAGPQAQFVEGNADGITRDATPMPVREALSAVTSSGRGEVNAAVGGAYPVEITNSLAAFWADHPDPSRVAFVMMEFGTSSVYDDIFAAIRSTLEPVGLTAVRADEREYHAILQLNIFTYMHGCGFGIAVYERIESDSVNPNVSLEVGYMLALDKHVCILRDSTLRTINADLAGSLYRPFNTRNPAGSIPEPLKRWLTDKHLISITGKPTGQVVRASAASDLLDNADDEPGFFDLASGLYEDNLNLGALLSEMNENITSFGARLKERSDQLQTMGATPSTTLPRDANIAMQAAAHDINLLAEQIEGQVPILSGASSSFGKNFGGFLNFFDPRSGREREQLEQYQVSVKELLVSVQSASESVSGMRLSANSLRGRMSRAVNHATARLVAALDAFLSVMVDLSGRLSEIDELVARSLTLQ